MATSLELQMSLFTFYVSLCVLVAVGLNHCQNTCILYCPLVLVFVLCCMCQCQDRRSHVIKLSFCNKYVSYKDIETDRESAWSD